MHLAPTRAQLLNSILQQLHDDRSLKAWSVIITFFGDSISPRGGAVSAGTIQSVMRALSIEDGTVRTALSRLSKDDWVKRNRSGRNSFYRLSDKGVEQFAKASPKIYLAPNGSTNTDPLLLIIPHTTTNLPVDFLAQCVKVPRTGALLLRATVDNQRLMQSPQHLVAEITADTLPAWLRETLVPGTIDERYRKLTGYAELLQRENPTDPLLALAQRTIIVHEWRRLLLRPDLAAIDTLFRIDNKYSCYAQVAQLYHQLTPLADQWLSEYAYGPDGLLPEANIQSHNRFLEYSA